jgi:glycosyltransferase involved in cell wall biosynthesis
MRLAVYLELPYRRDADGLSTDRAFIRFVLAVGEHFDTLRLIGRLDPAPGRVPYALPQTVEFAPLPDYSALRNVPALLLRLPRIVPAIWRGLDDVDVVWSLGPHPLSVVVALCALARRRSLVLGVRQDFPAYVRGRAPAGHALAAAAVAAARTLDACFRLLARRVPTIVVGAALARRYPRALELAVSLVPADGVGPVDHTPAGGPLRLLSVGRLDPEKSPETAIDALALLRRDGVEARLDVVGVGSLERGLRARAAALGDAVVFHGYVAHGPELFALYRQADVFVHSARTEGLPQVVLEAQALGVPVVAAAVGGVPEALGGGEAGLLVPPADAAATAAAVRRLAGDSELQARVVRAGLERTRGLTLEAQAARAAAFIGATTARH